MTITVRGKHKRVTRRELDVKYGITPYQYEEGILAEAASDGRSRVQIYTVPQPVVVLGRGSDPEVELCLPACLADSVPLQRRRGGGCAVLLDPGCIVVATAIHATGIGQNKAHFDRLTDWMIEALSNIGFPNITGDGISDLVLEDRKVAGTCLYRRKDLLLYSAALLITPGLEWMERYLAHPPREPDYRRGRSHREFVRGLPESNGQRDVEEVSRQLSSTLRPIDLGT